MVTFAGRGGKLGKGPAYRLIEKSAGVEFEVTLKILHATLKHAMLDTFAGVVLI